MLNTTIRPRPYHVAALLLALLAAGPIGANAAAGGQGPAYETGAAMLRDSAVHRHGPAGRRWIHRDTGMVKKDVRRLIGQKHSGALRMNRRRSERV